MRLARLSKFLRGRAAAASVSEAQPLAGIAQLLWAPVGGVSIDIQRPEIRAHPDGFEVRGWLLVRHGDLPQAAELALARERLAALAPLTRQIFLMNRREGLTFEEIANNLDLSVGQIRRHMMSAIAALDGRDLRDQSGGSQARR